MRVQVANLASPIGDLALAATPAGLCLIHFGGGLPLLREHLARRFGAFECEAHADPGGAVGALRRYFEGRLDALDTLPVDPGGTPFQQQVWLALRHIRAGATWSYSELARAVDRPRAVRAVGAANGQNPLPLVLPCHRVIGADGSLTGYGGGLERKAWLLRHEGARPGDLFDPGGIRPPARA